jgi:hypothetical protein
MAALHHNRELKLITDLCRPLARIGLNVGMSDARPAAMIRTGSDLLCVTVDSSGEFFEWSEASRHPATDPTGAAALIAAHVKAQQPTPGEVS